METIREQTFETNSSSMHSFTVGVGIRDRKEFPEPDEYGRIHIPWRRFEDLDGLDSFTSIVQLLVIILINGSECTSHLEDLFMVDEGKRAGFIKAVQLAYEMAGLDEIDGVVIDLPQSAHALELNEYETCIDGVANWSDMELMLSSNEGSVKDLGAQLLLCQNNTALSLVSAMSGKCADYDILYTAALLAMNVHGKIDYD